MRMMGLLCLLWVVMMLWLLLWWMLWGDGVPVRWSSDRWNSRLTLDGVSLIARFHISRPKTLGDRVHVSLSVTGSYSGSQTWSRSTTRGKLAEAQRIEPGPWCSSLMGCTIPWKYRKFSGFNRDVLKRFLARTEYPERIFTFRSGTDWTVVGICWYLNRSLSGLRKFQYFSDVYILHFGVEALHWDYHLNTWINESMEVHISVDTYRWTVDSWLKFILFFFA